MSTFHSVLGGPVWQFTASGSPGPAMARDSDKASGFQCNEQAAPAVTLRHAGASESVGRPQHGPGLGPAGGAWRPGYRDRDRASDWHWHCDGRRCLGSRGARASKSVVAARAGLCCSTTGRSKSTSYPRLRLVC